MPYNMKKAGMKYKAGGEKLMKALAGKMGKDKAMSIIEQAKYGKEKMLNKMTMGGMMDMSQPMEMRYGGATTYSGKKKKKK